MRQALGPKAALGPALRARACIPQTYLSVNPLLAAGGVFHTSIEVDGEHVLGARLLPGVAESEPVIGLLSLQGRRKNYAMDSLHPIQQNKCKGIEPTCSPFLIFCAKIPYS